MTLNDFLRYYSLAAATIEDDKYFDLIVNNVWNVGQVSYGKGWGS